MFSQLRRKFTLINFSISSLVMVITFVSIYLLILQDVNRNAQTKLDVLLNTAANFDQSQPSYPDSSASANLVPTISVISTLPAFVLRLSSQGKIVTILDAIPGYTVTDFQMIASYILKNPPPAKRFAYLDNTWTYQLILEPDGHQLLAVLEMNETVRFLHVFFLILLGISLVLFFVIYFASYLLASKALKPVDIAWQQQKQFFQDAAHEFKNPLAIITSNLDVLRTNQDQTVASQSQWLDNLQLGVERLNALLKQMLRLSRLESGNLTLKKTHLNLSDIINLSTRAVTPHLLHKNLHFQSSVKPDITIYSNYDLIYQIISILISNAIKYTNPNGTITVTLTSSGSSACYQISNTGAGIARKDLPHIFQRFYRGRHHPSNGYQPSHGLGLAIARTIAQQLRGTLTAQSNSSQTTFTLTLPSK